MSVLRLAVLAAALPLALIADEEVSHHLRLSGHLLPDAYSITANNSTTSGEYDGFTRLRLGYLASIPFDTDGAFLIGVHAVNSTIKGEDGTADIDQLGGGVEVGVAATPQRNLAFEFTAQGGMGMSEGDNTDGHYGEFGLTVRPALRLSVVELFAELGYFWQKQKLDEDAGDYDLRTSGAQFALGAGLVF